MTLNDVTTADGRYIQASCINVNVNVNVNKQYLSTRKSCNKNYDGCAMRVVFSKLQNCPGFKTKLLFANV